VAAPNITASTRYARFGVTRVVYALTVSNYNSPTRAEINAGTDLSNEVAEIDGFQVVSGFIETPDLGTSFTSKIAGRTSSDDSSVTMYASVNSVDVRTLLPRGTTGYFMWFDEGDVPGRKFDIYPITVGSVAKERSTGDDPARLVVSVAITRQPAENVTVPA
jgi:hypothetical protein